MAKSKNTKVKLEYLVPDNKFERFCECLAGIKTLMEANDIEDVVNAKYEPLKEDFEYFWKQVRDEEKYHLFDNWWNDFLSQKCHEIEWSRKLKNTEK